MSNRLVAGILQALIASGIAAAPSRALADPLADCVSRVDPAVRLDACSRVIDGSYQSGEKAKALVCAPQHGLAPERRKMQSRISARRSISNPTTTPLMQVGARRTSVARNAGAIDDFSQSIRLAPKSASYNARGHAYLVTGKTDLAIADFSEAIRLDPKSASAFNNRGLAQTKAGNPVAAITDYTAAIALNPRYALAYNNRGYAHEAKGEKAEAIADFDRALQIEPTLAGARAGLKRLGVTAESTASTDMMVVDGQHLAEKTAPGVMGSA